jgi:phosphatidate phosphatase APP1
MAHGPGPKHPDEIIILPYLGYGTSSKLTVCGRVLEDEGFRPAGDRDSRWRNLVHFWKRLESDEVPGARLRARFRKTVKEGVTDREGYFRLEMPARSLKGGVWYPVELELQNPIVQATARVLVPSPRARFGLISDIDDTIVSTNVTRKVRMIVSLALSSARTRKPFPGVAAFYRALHADVNPVFYVSKSPWNLYAPLIEYLDLQGFPRGPLLLRDFGLRPSRTHKTDAIEEILKTYPKLRFVLSGDSGEHDPEIYSALVRRYPERIRAIYIRSVDVKRIREVERLAAEVSRTGCQLVLAPDAETAAAHAAAEGLIQASELRAVRADSASDRSSSKPALSSGGLK